jgi:hypothetical protein
LIVLSVNDWGRPVLHDLLGDDLAIVTPQREVEIIEPVNHRIDVWRLRLQLLDATSHLPPEEAAHRFHDLKADIGRLVDTVAAGKPPEESGLPITVGPGLGFSLRDALGLEPRAWGYLSPDAGLEIAGRVYDFHRPRPDDHEFTAAIRTIATYRTALAGLEAGRAAETCVKDLAVAAGAALPTVLGAMLGDDEVDELHERVSDADRPSEVIADILGVVETAARVYGRWPDHSASDGMRLET